MTERSPLARLVPVEAPATEAPAASVRGRGDQRPATRRTAARRPDARIVVGLVLVLISVALGVRMVGAPSTSTIMWATTRDLPADTKVMAADLKQISVAEPLAGYVPASESIVGETLVRPIAAGEFVHSSVIARVRLAPKTRLVTVAVDPLRAPTDLQRGHKVDVWSTPIVESVISAPMLVLANLFVSHVPLADQRGISSSIGITLEVPQDQVGVVIAAMRSGEVDVVRVPSDEQ